MAEEAAKRSQYFAVGWLEVGDVRQTMRYARDALARHERWVAGAVGRP